MIEFFVNGKPATAGSKKGFYNKKLGRVMIVNDSKRTMPWMEAVKWAAIQQGYDGRILLGGAIHLTVHFTFLRPKSHLKKDGSLTKSARKYHTCKPDLTKLTRAVEDALTGIIWRDDSQVILQSPHKGYGDREGVFVNIEEIK